MVSKLPLDEINGLREIFKAMDKRHTGRVTLKEFADALKQMGTKLPEADLRAMWKVGHSTALAVEMHRTALAAAIAVWRWMRLRNSFGCRMWASCTCRHATCCQPAMCLCCPLQEIDQDGDGTLLYEVPAHWGPVKHSSTIGIAFAAVGRNVGSLMFAQNACKLNLMAASCSKFCAARACSLLCTAHGHMLTCSS